MGRERGGGSLGDKTVKGWGEKAGEDERDGGRVGGRRRNGDSNGVSGVNLERGIGVSGGDMEWGGSERGRYGSGGLEGIWNGKE